MAAAARSSHSSSDTTACSPLRLPIAAAILPCHLNNYPHFETSHSSRHQSLSPGASKPEYECGDLPAISRPTFLLLTEALSPLNCSAAKHFYNSAIESSRIPTRTLNMGRSTIPSALAELSNPTSSEAQVAALRNLKNEIVGHEQRKELAVTYGVVRPLAGLLREGVRRGGKRRHSNGTTQETHNGPAGSTPSSGAATLSRIRQAHEDWTKEDELRFQATLVIGSLANGEHVTLPYKSCWGPEG